jgi:hypothetical protein
MRKGRRFKNVLVVKLNERSSFLLIFKQAYDFPIEIGIAERPIDIGPCTCRTHSKACLFSIICQMSMKRKKINPYDIPVWQHTRLCEESWMSSRITMHFLVFHGELQVAQEQLTGLETDALRPRDNFN